MLPWGAGGERKGKKLPGEVTLKDGPHRKLFRVYITWVGQEFSKLDVLLPDRALSTWKKQMESSSGRHIRPRLGE